MAGSKSGRRSGSQKALDTLIAMDVVGLAALGLATNISTGLLSDEKAWPWAHNPYIMWPTVVGLVVLLVAFALVRRKLGSKQDAGKTAAPDFQTKDVTDSTVVAGGNSGTVVTAPSSTFIGTVETINFSTAADTERKPTAHAQTNRPISNLPPRNATFTGRGQQLDDISALLGKGPVAVVALRGLGGIGKSTLALHYAHERLTDETYRIAWWIRAENQITLLEDLAALAPKLGLPTEQDQRETVSSVMTALNQNNGWLLVFDNATDPDFLRTCLPSSGGGHVLVTSRERGWTGLAKPLELEVFKREEAIEFMRERTGKHEPEATAQLVAELGYLPLALAQAAAYIDIHSMSINTYLKLVQDRQEAAKLLTRGLPTSEYPASVATTWLLHFDDLKRNNQAALDLLRICAFLAPDDIPVYELLNQVDKLPKQLAQASSTPTGIAETVGALTKTHLATKTDGESEGLYIHRLVQAVTRHHLVADEQHVWANFIADKIISLLPEDLEQPISWPRAARLAAHARIAAEHAADTRSVFKLLFWLGGYSLTRAELTPARDFYERALTIEERIYGPTHPDIASTLSNLGTVHRELGELRTALQLQQRALTIEEQAYGPDHPNIASTLSNLGTVHQLLGDTVTARDLYERALTIEEQAYGPDHPGIASTLSNLGLVHQQLGDLTTALELQQRALTIKEQAYGPDHPQVATTLTNLGLVHQQLGDLTTALELQQRALTIKEQIYGPDHPQVATTLDNLGTVRQQLGELGTALELQQRALTIKEQAYGPDHPEAGAILSNLGTVHRELGELTTALQLQQRALTIQKQAYGPDHPDIANTLINLGIVHQQLGELTTALQLQQRALTIQKQAYGPDHPDIANTLINLGLAHQQLGELTTARDRLERALAIVETAYGLDHPLRTHTKTLLATLGDAG
ncbi:FxSxx-COOH system tetratricopeptide repeat protein [Saccharopolyspora endophytica]|uniref:Tetratricopeptide repeat protein n=1 Tax=Saccharopolyspora endophytica TaxID=543886 RepID=A0ABS5D8R5_9PSEU|nr:FxSxx-COOH system tetratricopeptide repeat protein [Saccharopolyspora endophytica]MBQ0922675.1 tetratricopeptide repeat protein [Saccharopolyspora endophytica]